MIRRVGHASSTHQCSAPAWWTKRASATHPEPPYVRRKSLDVGWVTLHRPTSKQYVCEASDYASLGYAPRSTLRFYKSPTSVARYSLRVMAIQRWRYAAAVHGLPWALQGARPSPTVAPAVEGTFAVIGILLGIDDINPQAAIPVTGNARWRREARVGFAHRRRAGGRCGAIGTWRGAVQGTTGEAQQGSCQGSRHQSIHGCLPSALSMIRRCTVWVVLANGCPWPIHSPLFASPAREMRATS